MVFIYRLRWLRMEQCKASALSVFSLRGRYTLHNSQYCTSTRFIYSAPTFIICLPFDFFSASLELSPSVFSFFLSLDSSSSVDDDIKYLR